MNKYNNKISNENLEDILTDFINFRKERDLKSRNVKVKGTGYSNKNPNKPKSMISRSEVSTSPSSSLSDSTSNENSGSTSNLTSPNINNSPSSNIPNVNEGSSSNEGYIEMSLLSNLLTGINKKIYPYMIEVLNEEEYEGSPIYNNYLDKEYVAQLVDKTMDKLANSIEEAEEAYIEMSRGHWSRYSLLRALTEKHILCELYAFRRPHYRYYNGTVWN